MCQYRHREILHVDVMCIVAGCILATCTSGQLPGSLKPHATAAAAWIRPAQRSNLSSIARGHVGVVTVRLCRHSPLPCDSLLLPLLPYAATA